MFHSVPEMPPLLATQGPLSPLSQIVSFSLSILISNKSYNILDLKTLSQFSFWKNSGRIIAAFNSLNLCHTYSNQALAWFLWNYFDQNYVISILAKFQSSFTCQQHLTVDPPLNYYSFGLGDYPSEWYHSPPSLTAALWLAHLKSKHTYASMLSPFLSTWSHGDLILSQDDTSRNFLISHARLESCSWTGV